ncbi:DUF3703 domain-containing protein [Nonomuraea sp. JJY05]|uniref:DUF3703 domain-containing protein n=1 Tax=Nonomuraea sp. JJY05 TaxID=3350255 RepID=UPI00373E6AC7
MLLAYLGEFPYDRPPDAHSHTHRLPLRDARRPHRHRAPGRYPDGNTGRATVGLTPPMLIPEDLALLLQAVN